MSERNDITALREALFDTLRGIRAGTVDIEKAKAINDTAQTIINTAKVEIDFAKHVDARIESDFIPTVDAKPLDRSSIGTVPRAPAQQLKGSL